LNKRDKSGVATGSEVVKASAESGQKSPRSTFIEEMKNIQIQDALNIRIQDRVEGELVCHVLQDWHKIISSLS